MSNTTKQWAFVAMAFIAGFGVSRFGNFQGHRPSSQQHEARANRAQWSKVLNSAKAQERLKAIKEGGGWRRGNDGRRRGKGENGPSK